MKCGSCRNTNADQYRKINPDDNLFDILKNLNATRAYNPKYAYFCEQCINKAATVLAHKLTTVSDQNANSFTLITDHSTSKASSDTSNSSKDEYDDIIVSKKFYTETGTPIIVPSERSTKAVTRSKPCPKRFKELQSIPEGSDRQEPAMPSTQTSASNSGATEPPGLMMSSPSLEDGIFQDMSLPHDSASGSDTNVTGQDANISGQNDRSADSPKDQHSSSGQSKRRLDPNVSSSQAKRRGSVSPNEVSITSPRRTEETRTQPRQSSTEKSDTESEQSSTNNSRTRAEKSRTQPRRSPTEKSDSDQSVSKETRTLPRRASAEKTRTQPRRASTETTRTQPRPVSTGKDDSDQSARQRTRRRPKTTTGKANPTHDVDSDTSSAHDGDGGTLAPAAKNPRMRTPITPMPRNLQEFFSKNSFVEVNFHPRTMAG
ncbi:serine/arginine repetitive matrix protein 2-like [Bradysia coprophila]|uniref:serine/arginine repetitive matrix protein 2-like n=1 Tax=Bradysia coprophila TaxID=38358 RepID=UPI00187DC389|nr:serine/arginine repetitive matrix protein 2-like [Bradysia coprophila]